MPRLAAPERLEPPREHFQELLQQLAAEYEELQQQNQGLSKQLRECQPQQQNQSQAVTSPRRPTSPKRANKYRRGSIASSVGEGRSSWRRSIVVEEGRRASFVAAGLPPERRSRRASRAINAISQGGDNLELQFNCLDVNQTGRLYLEDLIRVTSDSDEPVDEEDLAHLVKVFNELEVNEDESTKSDDNALAYRDPSKKPSIGLRSFTQLMDEQLSYSHLGSHVQGTVNALRKAFLEQRCGVDSDEVVVLRSTGHSKVRKRGRQCWTVLWLEVLPTVVILFNTLLTGLSTDYEHLHRLWETLESVCAAFYIIEFLFKLRVYGCSWYFGGPERYWNWFDFVCLLVSVADLAIEVLAQGESQMTKFMLIKIFRLARLARLVRTLRFKVFQELKLMVLGVLSGLRVLTWAVVLLVLLIYLVGVGMTNMIGRNEPEFESVVASMFTLFRCWTDGCAAYDGRPLAERLRTNYGEVYVIFHILLTMFVTVGVFNLIMAIFVDNVVNAQTLRRHREMADRSEGIEMKLKKQLIAFVTQGVQHRNTARKTVYDKARDRLGSALRRSGSDDSELNRAMKVNSVNKEWDTLQNNRKVLITKEVFREWLEDQDFQRLLGEAEIEMTSYLELFDVLDADMGGLLSMEELITGLMQLRGPVTKADVVAVRLKVGHLTQLLEAWDEKSVAAPSVH